MYTIYVNFNVVIFLFFGAFINIALYDKFNKGEINYGFLFMRIL